METNALQITSNITLPLSELELSAVRSSGPGGQNVNTVSTAVQLRLDVTNSSLPPEVKDRLQRMGGKKITKEGVLVIKAQTARTQEGNRQEVLRRLKELIRQATIKPKPLLCAWRDGHLSRYAWELAVFDQSEGFYRDHAFDHDEQIHIQLPQVSLKGICASYCY